MDELNILILSFTTKSYSLESKNIGSGISNTHHLSETESEPFFDYPFRVIFYQMAQTNTSTDRKVIRAKRITNT